MTRIKDLKKEINYFTMELISECYTYMHFHPEESDEKVNSVVADLVNLRNELIARVNNPEEIDNHKSLKAHYKKILKDLYEKGVSLMDKLGDYE